jgi:hypothetical protein
MSASSRRLRASLFGVAAAVALAACSPKPPSGAPQAQGDAKPLPPVGSYKTSDEHYEALKTAANGGQTLAWDKLPDWSGLWSRKMEGPVFAFDPHVKPVMSMGPMYGGHTAELTPEYQAKLDKKIAEVSKGVEWDTLSNCLPAGHPRWLTEPFLKEIIVTPKQTWWINEQQSEVRRIYTDDRGHVPADEAYPMWEGDSIGFWNNGVLTVHTNNLKSGQYQRGQPDYSEQTTTVEEIRMVNKDLMEDRITVYDPPSLKKPWTVTIRFERVTTPNLRIAMWSCNENNNVVQTADGNSDFILPGEKGYKDPNNLAAGGAK